MSLQSSSSSSYSLPDPINKSSNTASGIGETLQAREPVQGCLAASKRRPLPPSSSLSFFSVRTAVKRRQIDPLRTPKSLAEGRDSGLASSSEPKPRIYDLDYLCNRIHEEAGQKANEASIRDYRLFCMRVRFEVC